MSGRGFDKILRTRQASLNALLHLHFTEELVELVQQGPLDWEVIGNWKLVLRQIMPFEECTVHTFDLRLEIPMPVLRLDGKLYSFNGRALTPFYYTLRRVIRDQFQQ